MTILEREKNIINIFTALCIFAGFLCFMFIILPDKLGTLDTGGSPLPPGPSKLSAIISVGTEETKTETPKTPPAAAEIPHPPKDIQKPETVRAAGAGSIEILAYPISSLAHREPSVLDTDLKKGKKHWLAVPSELEAEVAFWKEVYAKYDGNQAILHHPRHLRIIYDVVDTSDIVNDPRLNDIEKERISEKRVEDRKDKVTEILRHLAANPPASALGLEDMRIKKLFDGIHETNAFKKAVDDGVRAQNGQRDKFLAGLKYSGRYLGEIEAIFDSYDLPRELTRLIFVESMFNPNAVSSAGASGIWQFMPATGRLYLKINALVDERNDPIQSSFAAARLLRHNFETLGNWPLAINAYNTGVGIIKQAVSRTGSTDISKIIRNFNHQSYGFASRNFFPEFLAALDTAEHAEKYFGPIEFDKPLRCESVRPTYNVSLPEVAKISDMETSELEELNPSFKGQLIAGKKILPIGFPVRVPAGKGELFLAAANRAPKSRLGPLKHLVQDGESLESIAQMYGVTPREIMKSNKDMSRFVHAGQTILVPVNKR